MKPRAVVPLLAALFLVTLPGAAADAAPEAAFAKAVESLERGAHDDAIDRLESLADSGFAHADASFNRALAYVARALSPGARPGDLGRAVAALEETLLLRPSDAEAERALERVRGEIARRRAREGAAPVVAKTTFGRAVVGLLPELAWAALAALGSLLLTSGLSARLFSAGDRRRFAANVVASVGGVTLLITGSLALGARHFRTTSRPAVVVVGDARLLDDGGRPLVQKGGVPEHVSVPEGTLLHVGERRGSLIEAHWGSTAAWVESAQVRVLTTSSN
jgi:hypothetical protein